MQVFASVRCRMTASQVVNFGAVRSCDDFQFHV